jgi:hypothetical protein
VWEVVKYTFGNSSNIIGTWKVTKQIPKIQAVHPAITDGSGKPNPVIVPPHVKD